MTQGKPTAAEFRCMMCGGRTPVEMAVENEAASRAVTRCMQSLGDVGRGMLAYMALHRPPKRTLTWEKVARLLDELLGLYDSGKVTRDGITTITSDAVWVAALAETRDAAPTLDLPLEGHGYLLAVLSGMARKAQRAGDAVKRGETAVGYSAAHAPAAIHAAPHYIEGDAGIRDESTFSENDREPNHSAALVEKPAAADRRYDVLAAIGQLKMGKRTPAPVADPDRENAQAVNPREGAKPKAVVPSFAMVDNRKQLVEIISRKGKNVTVKLLEAAEGFENVTTISVKDLL